MSLRKRLADSPRMNRAVAALFRGWLRMVWATSRIEAEGWDNVARALDTHGAVILVCWHQRLMMTPYIFDLKRAPCRSLTSDGRAGRLAGWLHRAYGYETMPLPRGMQGAAAMREVLRGLKRGVSIGMAPDGPRGPARKAKVTPIQWARVAQVPIFAFTFSASRFATWSTWDRLMFPLPFTRICLDWQEWDRAVPARATEAETEALAAELEAFMNRQADRADRRVGHADPCR